MRKSVFGTRQVTVSLKENRGRRLIKSGVVKYVIMSSV